MEGELDFTEALSARLNRMKPSRKDLERFLVEKPPSLTPGVKDLIQRLQANKIHVCLVSGGLHPLVSAVAKILDIPEENVYTNRLLFDTEGNFHDFDKTAPTCRSDGKAVVVSELMQRFQTDCVMIGDGMTDAHACPPALVFLGFGGNVDRTAVRAVASDLFFTRMEDIVRFFESVGVLPSQEK